MITDAELELFRDQERLLTRTLDEDGVAALRCWVDEMAVWTDFAERLATMGADPVSLIGDFEGTVLP